MYQSFLTFLRWSHVEYFLQLNFLTGVAKYGSDSERDSIIGHDLPISNLPTSHTRIHSPLFHPQPRIPYPFHPHPHPHSSPLNLPSSQSRDSFCFEPPYPSMHSHSPSVDGGGNFQKRAVPVHAHGPHSSSYIVPISYSSQGFESRTFPRNQRFRIPSNPSVTSKNSAGKGET